MSELDFLLETALVIEAFGDASMVHLTSPLSLREYVRIADEVARASHGKRVLDWGCGYGQMSQLLKARGLEVTSYDVGPKLEDERVPFTRGLEAVRADHPYWLPFRSGAFDAVLSCGVLEHVLDVDRSLDEIRRVLGPVGQLFVYNLPQRTSYKELVVGRLRLGYTHPRRYTKTSVRALLEGHGFRVARLRRAGLLPHLATGLPSPARRAYYRVSSGLFGADRVLSHLPVVNLLAESLEVVAEKA